MFNLGEISMMKKSLVALAALAATGAFAQSAVTMYGVAEATVDIGYKATTDGSGRAYTITNATGAVVGVVAPANNTQGVTKAAFRVQDGSDQGVGTSRIGWRGTEDLGGGLKANFQLEMGLRIDDGDFAASTNGGGNLTPVQRGNSAASGGSLFGRNAWVGASGGFGEVRLGRQVLGSFGVQANGWAAGSSNGLYDAGSSTAPAMGGVRFSNAIKYISPNLGGVSGSVTLRAPENTTSTSTTTPNPGSITFGGENKAKVGLDLAIEYANGPIYVGAGYNKADLTGLVTNNGVAGAGNLVTTGLNGPTKAFTFSASYNFGVVQPFFNYTTQKAETSQSTISGVPAASTASFGQTKQNAFALGLKAPFGPVTVIAGFGRNKIKGSGSNFTGGILGGDTATDGKISAFQLGAQYALSKRTMVEANVGTNKNTSSLTTRAVGALTTGYTIADTTTKTRALNVGVRHSF
jgi:predicted porin